MTNDNIAVFTMNGRTYTTDTETLQLLRTLVPAAKATNDTSAVTAVMHYGLAAGRIQHADNVTLLNI